MFATLPKDHHDFLHWTWADYAPYAENLIQRALSAQTVQGWLADWTALASVISEQYQRLAVAAEANTADQAAEEAVKAYLDGVYPRSMEAEQKLKQKLLDSRLEPDGLEMPLRNMRAEAALFRQANLPLLSEEAKLSMEYNKISGAQTVEWEGRELTVAQMRPIFQEQDREVRERAWRLAATRQLADRGAVNALWQKFLALRLQLAKNADQPDYRAYRWQMLHRFDYTSDDARRFQEAIEQVAVPAALRIYERRKARLGVSSLRPWDLNVDVTARPPLRPFQSLDELTAGTSAIFHRVDAQLGGNFDTMLTEGLLDLDNRKNKAPGGFCTDFAVIRRPFIFMNAVGLHDDVQTLLHEGGHAFHVFETAPLPYIQQLIPPMEFAEVASMSMELLSAPYLTREQGGFYSEADAARAHIEHLEAGILFWPYMAVVDAFQHWVYENPQQAADPAQCDATWARLWARFMIGVDWSGLEDELVTGWQRKLHIHLEPFYYIEYGLAQLGAVQVFANSLKDRAGAVASYRKALALGGTVPLPKLFQAAGARLAFDAATLQDAVALMEETMERLEAKI